MKCPKCSYAGSVWTTDGVMYSDGREGLICPECRTHFYYWKAGQGIVNPDATVTDAEVERLRTENAAMREIVQAVAKCPMIFGLFPAMYLCNYCDVYIGGIFGRTDHRADCPVAKARALLGMDEGEGVRR